MNEEVTEEVVSTPRLNFGAAKTEPTVVPSPVEETIPHIEHNDGGELDPIPAPAEPEPMPADPYVEQLDTTVTQEPTLVSGAVAEAIAETEAEATGEDPATATAQFDTAEVAKTENAEPAPVPADDETALADSKPVDDIVAADEQAADLVLEEVAPSQEVEENEDDVETLKARRDALDEEIEARTAAEKAAILTQIKAVCQTYSISVKEVVDALGGLPNKRKGVPAIPKYKDPATGVTWSGRGKTPAWIMGKKFEDFLIPASDKV